MVTARCAAVGVQALDAKKLKAMLGAADGSKAPVVTVAACAAKNAIKGDRLAQDELLDQHEVEEQLSLDGRRVGATYEVGQTKVRSPQVPY